jgi:CubicO group peptidase (beta-lactamase class C family)
MNTCSKYSKLRLPADLECRLEAEFQTAIGRGVFSGASLLISKDRANFAGTWGTVESGAAAVTSSTRFDLASLTKPLVTAPLCMAAMQRGVLNLDDTLCRFFPGAVPKDKKEITIGHLLSHSSGLPPYKPFYLKLIELPPEVRREALLAMLLETPLDAAPGKVANYSDLGFMLLGLILEGLMGERLDGCAHANLFARLGIDELEFCPMDRPEIEDECGGPEGGPDCVLRASGSRYAATQLCPWRKRLLFGEVDDENAWCLNGVAGHAGLFGTAGGIFSLLSFLWDVYDGNITDPLWPRDLVKLFWTRSDLAGTPGDWCLGYDTPGRKSSSGRHFSSNTIGHLGFTGVSFWLDLEKGVLVVLLTNRVHPTRQNDEIRQLRPVLHDIIMEALIYGK